MTDIDTLTPKQQKAEYDKKFREKSRLYYNEKIHNNPEFYEAEKKRALEYQRKRLENDPEYREKRKEYCRVKMRELYQKRKSATLELQNPTE